MGDEGADAVTGDGRPELNGGLPGDRPGADAAAVVPAASQNEPAGHDAAAGGAETGGAETGGAEGDTGALGAAEQPEPERDEAEQAGSGPAEPERADPGPKLPELPIAPVVGMLPAAPAVGVAPVAGMPPAAPAVGIVPAVPVPPVVPEPPTVPIHPAPPVTQRPEPVPAAASPATVPSRPVVALPATPGSELRPVRLRTAVGIGVVSALILAAITTVATMTVGRESTARPGATATTGSSTAQSSPDGGVGAGAGSPSPSAPANATVTLAGTGDIVMGRAPANLPPKDAQGFFDPVANLFTSDLLMGNLEQTLTDDTGTAKCSAESSGKTCFAFRTPPSYAGVLHDAGFDVMNMANNHAFDFGQRGYTNTQQALEAAGLHSTGAPGVVTVVQVAGVRVAVVGFAPYPSWANDVNDIPAATALVTKASQQADIVVVQAHLGAEGADRTHVKAGTETYLGENRGDPIQFAHAVVDAGADLVIGHGPHVMRGAEFYKGRLIAYSLGNFAGYKALGSGGVVGVGGVLKVTLRADGSYLHGGLSATVMNGDGLPRPDPKNQAFTLVGNLSKEDFGSAGARIDAAGAITQQ